MDGWHRFCRLYRFNGFGTTPHSYIHNTSSDQWQREIIVATNVPQQ